jgi:hypothetical protein
MNRERAADDFETIRFRLQELRREHAQPHADGGLAPAMEQEAAALSWADRRTSLVLRRLLWTRFWNAR